eukprot:COSAG01_NODE_9121_length_2545_cov_2.343418_1_plen_96_part_00
MHRAVHFRSQSRIRHPSPPKMMRASAARSLNRSLPAVALPTTTSARSFSSGEFFPNIPKIPFDPSSKPSDMTFKYYDANEVWKRNCPPTPSEPRQ